MGGRSGRGIDDLIGGGGRGGKIFQPKNIESLKNIKDAELYKEMKAAISRFHSALGIREKEVKLADIGRYLGVQVNENGQSVAIYLSKRRYKYGTAKTIAEQEKKDYASGWSTITNKPVAHTITHELAHATWNDSLKGAKYQAAGNEVRKLYNEWARDRKKTGYGKYAYTNSSEFWAETITKGIHGKADKYTKAAFKIAQTYEL